MVLPCKKEYFISILIVGFSLFSIGYFLFDTQAVSLFQYLVGVGIGGVLILMWLGGYHSFECYKAHASGKADKMTTEDGDIGLGFKFALGENFFIILGIILLIKYYPWGFF